MLGLIGAMEVEVELLRSQMENPTVETVSGIDYIRGRLEGHDVVLARSGLGKVFAAICAQTMILKYEVCGIVNSGVGGTLTTELHIGDVAVSNACVQHDIDTSPVGDPVGLISGINLIRLPCSETFVAEFGDVCDRLGVNYRCGVVASGDQFVNTRERREWIGKTFKDCIAVEMEAAAIAQVCYVNKIPFVSLRVISDEASGDVGIDYATFVQKAARRSSTVTLDWLRHRA